MIRSISSPGSTLPVLLVILGFMGISYTLVTAPIMVKATAWLIAIAACVLFRRHDRLLHLLLTILVLSCLMLILDKLSSPWPIALAIGLAWFAFLAYRYQFTARVIFFNVAAVLLVLLVAETILLLIQESLLENNKGARHHTVEVTSTCCTESVQYDYFFDDHPSLGYQFKESIIIREAVRIGDSLAYDATYTIDGNRFRRTENLPSGDVFAVDVVGDSYSFGQGVDDNMTLAYKLNELGNGTVSARNLGVVGHGPHQILAYLEDNLYPSRDAPTRLAIYIAIPDHINRVSGWAKWDRDGPLFLADSRGNSVRHGNFRDHFEFVAKGILLKSNLFDFVFSRTGYSSRRVSQYIAILRTLSAHYRDVGSRFLVLHWGNNDDALNKLLMSRYSDEGIDAVFLGEIVDDFEENYSAYVFRGDNHPNERAHSALASAIFDMIADTAPPLSPGLTPTPQ